MIAWFFVGVAVTSAAANRGWLSNLRDKIRLGRYRGKHRGPSASHPAAKALDTRPSTKPLTHTEWLHEAYFDDAPQQIHTAR